MNENITWNELLETLTELKKNQPDVMNSTVVMCEVGGSESFGVCVKTDKQHFPYILTI